MKRELAGVVACLQEIEVALARLSEESLKPVSGIILEFFRTADVEKAREVLDWLQEFGSDSTGLSIVKREVEVDGLRTNLERLAQELDEVLEDLE